MSDLPLWFRVTILSILVLALLGVLIADARSRDFDAGPTAIALITVIGGAIGLDVLRRGGSSE